MTTIEFLSHLRSKDIRVWPEGDKLRYDAPPGALTPDLRKELVDRKQEILVFLRRDQVDASHGAPPILPVARERGLPLSFAQQRLWFLQQLAPASAFYNTPVPLRLHGHLDRAALQRSLNELVVRQQVLRTVFNTEGDTPVQIIDAPAPVIIAEIDLTHLPTTERDVEVRLLMAAEAQRPFDLSCGPLFRVRLLRLALDDHVLLMTLHHIITDGWSIGVLVRELAAMYEAFAVGEPSPLPELPIQYADFAVWQREWLRGKVLEGQLSYWKQRLRNLPTLQLPTDHPRPAIQTYRGAYEVLLLTKELREGLKALSRRLGATLFMVLLAAFKALLHRYTGQEDIVVGSPIANRNRAEIEGLIGFFVNSLVMRTDVSSDPSFLELVARVREVALGGYAHQDLPFEKLVEELEPERDLSRNPLFQVMFALQNAPMPPLELGDLRLSLMWFDTLATRFDLETHVWEEPEGLKVFFVYSTDLFGAATIKRMERHFQTLLEGIVANPETRLSELPVLSEAEKHQLLVEWNDTKRNYPEDKRVHELFEEQAERSPDAVAAVYAGQQLTYGELNRRANQLAHYLRKRGVGPESLVGICVARSLEMVVGLLGILKAGGAYVPLDPDYPKERLGFMVRDSQVAVVLTQQGMAEKLPQHTAQVIKLDRDWQEIALESDENLGTGGKAENLAYVIYTSGSTGRPKGISIPHKAINRLVFNTNYVRLEPSDRIAQASNASFDAATFEIWGALLNGAQLVGISKDVVLSPPAFSAEIGGRGISALFLTTALFNHLASEAPRAFQSVRHLLFGGEAVDPRWVNEVLTQGPPKRLLHVYGPTESTTFASFHLVEQVPQGATTIPIGRPLSNTEIYLLDRNLQLVPIGVAGELHIGGDGLARGYLNSPELTSEKFIPDPFSDEAGARLYKTGDLARYLADGSIEFLGRLDQQVKIRGFRIELGEIETTLSAHPGVREAVVVALQAPNGEKTLAAYIVPQLKESQVDADLDQTEQQAEQVAQWQAIFDDHIYARSAVEHDSTFNIAGWKSSYTGEPIPAAEMREWLEDTVERVLAPRPWRVLEIGCGTGLVLFKVAAHCERYIGTDISRVALDYVREHLDRLGARRSAVTLLQRRADNFDGFEPGSFDAVVLNSVVQYFPDVEYLLRVLQGAARLLAPGGMIFLGDVRSLPLLRAFHTGVQLCKAEATLSIAELRQRVEVAVTRENELVINPEFFRTLREAIPEISRVEILPKRGRALNELTRFRYQVVLQIGEPVGSGSDLQWMDWEEGRWNLEAIARALEEKSPATLALRRVPNGRLVDELWATECVAQETEPVTVGQLREMLGAVRKRGVYPDELLELARRHGYLASLDWAHDREGRYNVVFGRGHAASQLPAAPGGARRRLPWRMYANNPMRGKLAREVAGTLVPELRELARRELPDYMMPSAFVVLDALPLNPNGKVDRRALPAPDTGRPDVGDAFEAPRTPVEVVVAEIWSEVLGVDRIGVKDNFFELGGHSLLATRLVSQLRAVFGTELPVRVLFEHPTIAGLVEIMLEEPARREKLEKTAIFMLHLAQLSDDEAQTRFGEKLPVAQRGTA